MKLAAGKHWQRAIKLLVLISRNIFGLFVNNKSNIDKCHINEGLNMGVW